MTAKKPEGLIISRTFDAPRELVWKAWTETERMKQWSCPKGFTMPFSEGDVRPGGAWRACMKSPDGEEFIACGTYREVTEPRLLTFTHSWERADGKPDGETLVTVTLSEKDGKTLMCFEQSGFVSAESRDGHADGWNECFEKLAASLQGGFKT